MLRRVLSCNGVIEMFPVAVSPLKAHHIFARACGVEEFNGLARGCGLKLHSKRHLSLGFPPCRTQFAVIQRMRR